MMIYRIFKPIITLPLFAHAAGALTTFVGFGRIKGKLDASYVASNHPVDYVTGQTGFSGAVIKGYYSKMAEAGTLDIYVQTQLIDFGFITAMACMGLFVCTLMARFNREASLGRGVGLFAGLSVLLGAACDVLENGISFLMLANPTDFANWLALPYSGFASVKFGLIALGLFMLVASLLLLVLGRLLKKPSLG